MMLKKSVSYLQVLEDDLKMYNLLNLLHRKKTAGARRTNINYESHCQTNDMTVTASVTVIHSYNEA